MKAKHLSPKSDSTPKINFNFSATFSPLNTSNS